MTSAGGFPPVDGLVVVDKPGGLTSHDVVARCRRLAGTRRVGHAGTLDPMATGVLLLGVGRATRLLGHLALTDKTYAATIRLGVATDTDDADGRVLAATGVAGVLDRGDDDAGDPVEAGLAGLRGDLEQVPSAYSAVSVGGVRAYAAARAGAPLVLAPRRVHVAALTVLGRCPAEVAGVPVLDVDVVVTCSTGTYVRALARDLGAALGVGGHLTALRRTRVGPFSLDVARSLAELEARWSVLPLAEAVAVAFPRRELDAGSAADVRVGRPLAPSGTPGPVGVFGPGGDVLALLEDRDGRARPLVVFAPA